MKKFLAFILVLAMTACALLTTVGAAKINASDLFDDIPSDWSTEALLDAVENGLLVGKDGKLLPKNNLTRAEMAAVICRALNLKNTASIKEFTDVPEDAWYHLYMSRGVAAGIFKGDGSNKLRPEDKITREEVFVVLARAVELKEGHRETLGKFSDLNNVSTWAVGYTAALVEGGYINGSNGKLNPKAFITRAEFAQIMYNIVDDYIDEPTTLTGKIDGNIVIRSSNVTIDKDAVISGFVIIGEECEKVEISEKAKIEKIIDKRPEVPEVKVDPDTGLEIEDDDGWSPTFRP